jgi:flagellin-specific chaperone FliS
MLALNKDPAATYRRIEFDARVSGAGQAELLTLLIEELLAALQSALFAHEHGHNQRKSAAMTRAIAVLTTLELGVTPGAAGGIGETLLHFYRGGKRTILDSVVGFDPEAIARLRDDFEDVRRSFVQR